MGGGGRCGDDRGCFENGDHGSRDLTGGSFREHLSGHEASYGARVTPSYCRRFRGGGVLSEAHAVEVSLEAFPLDGARGDSGLLYPGENRRSASEGLDRWNCGWIGDTASLEAAHRTGGGG